MLSLNGNMPGESRTLSSSHQSYNDTDISMLTGLEAGNNFETQERKRQRGREMAKCEE